MASITTGKYPAGHEVLNNKKLLHFPIETKFKLVFNPQFFDHNIQLTKKVKISAYFECPDGSILKVDGNKTSIHNSFLHNAKRGGLNMGKLFERELTSDLRNKTNYHPNVVEKLKTILSNRPFVVEDIGGENSRRSVKLDDDGMFVHSRNYSEMGDIIADLRLKFDDNTYENLSLKYSNNYSILNCGIMKYINDDVDRRNFLSSLGIDYIRFEEDFNIYDNLGFEPHLNESPILMLENLVKSGLGSNYIMVHKIDSENIIVERMPTESYVKITDVEYNYLSEKRKYFRMSMNININNHKYKGSLQIRNVRGDFVPHVISFYLRKTI